jgi:hypothetical protein
VLHPSFRKAVRSDDVVTVSGVERGAATRHPVVLSVHRDAHGWRIALPAQGLEGWGDDAYAALDALRRQLSGTLWCCGSCRHFHMTGMSRQMSSGRKGYCLLFVREHGRSLDDVVEIFDACDAFEERSGSASQPPRPGAADLPR